MRDKLLLLGLLAGGASLGVAAVGDVHGRIIVSRPLTKKSIPPLDYQFRGVSTPVQPKAEVDEFSRIAVYLEGENLPSGARVDARLNQENRRFTPEIVVVPVGSSVAFPNGDPIYHNVFSLSRARQFDLGYYPVRRSRSVIFDKPGVVQVYCHVHTDMSAAVVVVPSAWYGLPDNNGRFGFSGVPAGRYDLVVWHKSAGFLRQKIEIPANAALEVDIDLPLTKKAGR